MPLITHHGSQQGRGWHRVVSICPDLTAGVYQAGYLANENRQWWQIDHWLSPAPFTPEAAARSSR